MRVGEIRVQGTLPGLLHTDARPRGTGRGRGPQTGRSGQARAQIPTYTLLAIDEWLVDKPDEQFRRFLLELMELRYDNASTAFATQLATKEWHSRLGGDTIADAILDRIVHNTVWIDTGEFNMRQRHGQSMLES